MKITVVRLTWLPLICALAVTNGCKHENKVEMVFTKKVKVTFRERRTSPVFGSAVVADKFGEKIQKFIKQKKLKPKDIISIGVVSATYKTKEVKRHDWTISASATVLRQDVPGGPVTDGPATFLNFTSQSLEAARKRVPANLNQDGVQLLNRALRNFVDGENPRIVITMENTSVDPIPTERDRLEFKWEARVVIQVVALVDVSKAMDDDEEEDDDGDDIGHHHDVEDDGTFEDN